MTPLTAAQKAGAQNNQHALVSTLPSREQPLCKLCAALLLLSVASVVAKAQTPSATVAPKSHLMSAHAIDHYQLLYGIEGLDVKAVESGQMIRFTWHVINPLKAAVLNDKKAQPFLIDPQALVRLEIPTMEKVGQLRQSSTPLAGESYWMVFSNKGGLVKPGDRVSIVIGKFTADGLYVR